MNRIIKRILDYLIRAQTIDPEDREIYEYGLDIMLFSLMNIIILMTMGLMVGKLLETAIILFLFGLLQSLGGGYHAQTHFRCFLGMFTLWIISVTLLFLSPWLHPLFFLFFAITGGLIILKLAPIEHPNAPASKQKLKSSAKKVRILALCLIVFTGLSLFLLPLLNIISYPVAISLGASGFSMALARFSQDRLQKTAKNI